MTLIDAVIGFALLEGLVLIAYHRRTGRGLAPGEVVAMLSAGLMLMLALRTATPAGTPTLAILLAAAGVAHGVDLHRRWRTAAR